MSPRTTRGRGHGITTMLSNFILSELQKGHQRTQLELSQTNPNHVAPVGKTLNGFTLHMKNLMENRVVKPGESANDARVRVWREASDSWRQMKNNHTSGVPCQNWW